MGSRLLVGNVELRFPLLRPFSASRRMYGPVPVEVAFFADGGVAWNSGESRPSSAALGRRVERRDHPSGEPDGYIPSAVRFRSPAAAAGRGWIFQFNLTPGF